MKYYTFMLSLMTTFVFGTNAQSKTDDGKMYSCNYFDDSIAVLAHLPGRNQRTGKLKWYNQENNYTYSSDITSSDTADNQLILTFKGHGKIGYDHMWMTLKFNFLDGIATVLVTFEDGEVMSQTIECNPLVVDP